VNKLHNTYRIPFRFRSIFWAAGFGVLALSSVSTGWAFESFEKVRSQARSSEGIIYDRHHQVLHELRINSSIRQLDWVPLNLISPVLKEAVLRSEDKRFWQHSGVDWTALLSSSLQNIWSKKSRGASTIAMQVASLLDQQLVPKKHRRDLLQKVKQIRGALDLEKTWTKEQVLETYLNRVTFRGELRGIAAGSWGLFGKAPHGLNLNESVLLATLIRSPAAQVTEVKARACRLGKELRAEFNCSELETVLSERGGLRTFPIRPWIADAPHVAQRMADVDFLAGEKSVTLDRDLQIRVADVLRRQVLSIRQKNAHDASAVVLDNVSGEVLAYVGGVGELSSASYVDGVRARRQAGSSLKPFLYAMALEGKFLTAASLLDDSPLDISIAGSVYRPRNYDNEFHGNNISLRTALASSLNVPAVKTLNLVGVGAFVQKLGQLGFADLREPDYYGPSLALGAADISLWDLTNAYRVLANGGLWSEAHLVSSEILKPSHRVYSPEASFLISNILSDRESRNLTFGLESPLSLKFWAAVKTGTSKDMRDNWCIGYSERYTVGVWVGNFSGEPMWNVTGVTGAAPAWSEIMNALHRKLPSHSPSVSRRLVRAQVGQPPHSEYFIRGTEPQAQFIGIHVAERSPPVHISYPVDGMWIARDPDIPIEHQRIIFTANGKSSDLSWAVNGQPTDAYWEPAMAGSFLLTLADAHGGILDQVRFSVK
jgi:penicillin-binding protein 1C